MIKSARIVGFSVLALGAWLLLARFLFALVHPSDLAAAGPRVWLGLGLVAASLAALAVVASARVRSPMQRPSHSGSLAVRLAWPGVATVAAFAVGGAVTTTTLADRFAHDQTATTAADVARYLVDQTRTQPLAEATAFLRAHATISGWSAIWIAPSGLLLPEESAVKVASWPSVEIPRAGALAGGRLRVAWPPHVDAHWPVVAIAVLVLLLALNHCTLIARRLARDIAEVARQVATVAMEEDDGAAPPRTTAWSTELRRLTTSTNTLLDEVPRLTMASFVAIERANEAQRFKSQFLANMSHDLRSPLNSILGFSELLMRGLEGPLQPAQLESLSSVHTLGLALLRLLGEILDTAKAESGRMELRRQSTAPAELLQQALSETRRSRAPGSALVTAMERLRVELQPGLASVYVDPLRMQQALTHLFNHLLDEEDNSPIEVRIFDATIEEDERRKRYLVVDVTLPVTSSATDGALDDLFEGAPGMASAAATAGRLRLALPLARRLAVAHGGDLVLLSEPIGAPPAEQRRHLRLTVPSGDQSQVGGAGRRDPTPLSISVRRGPVRPAPAK